MGEISKCIRKIAYERDCNLIVVMTNSFDSYNSNLSLELIDGAIIIINAVSLSFAEKLTSLGIPVVTTIEDYYPFAIDVVTTGHAACIEEAFDHLYDQGHRKIGFAGMISNPDFRKRYEKVLFCYKRKGMTFDPNHLYDCNEPTLVGGREIGKNFLDNDCPCTALICGSDLIALGINHTVRKARIKVPDDLALTGVDNIYLGKKNRPAITSIDQNLCELSSAIFDRLELRLSGQPHIRETTFLPSKLIIRESSCTAAPVPERVETNPEIEDEEWTDYLHNINANSSMSLAQSGYESIVNLSHIWGPFFKWGSFCHWKRGASPDSDYNLNISQLFSDSLSDSDLSAYVNKSVPPESFPSHSENEMVLPEHFIMTHIQSYTGKDRWSLLTLVEETSYENDDFKYNIYNNQLDLIAFSMQREALIEKIESEETISKELAQKLETVSSTSNDGFVSWNLKSNKLEWNQRIIDILGYDEENDIGYFSSIGFFDLIHDDDLTFVKESFKNHIEEHSQFNCEYRMKSKSNQYIWIKANGETIREQSGEISRFVASLTDITDNRMAILESEFLKYNDSLTKLPNKSYFLRYLTNQISLRPESARAVMLLDINRFNNINLSFGHKIGDLLLQTIAQLIPSALRENDFLSYYGGSQFIFACEIKDADEALFIGDRILKFLNFPYTINEREEIQISGSLGLSLYPEQGSSTDELIKKAAIALIESKKAQLNKSIIFSGEFNFNIKEIVLKEKHLLQSLEKGELYILLQPQIDSQTNLIKGAEILSRWLSPIYGEISPDEFIPMAEEIGFQSQIDKWVSLRALQLLKEWEPLLSDDFELSVNISSERIEMFNSIFIEQADALLKQFGVAPRRLNMEITESQIIKNIEKTKVVLAELREMGIQISLDDFGTGYSSLNILKELPVNWVKIDKSFIDDMTQENPESCMVGYITQMCHHLGYKVVAEGAETKDQVDQLKTIGCDLIQGFYYDKPLSVEAFFEKYIKFQS